LTAEDQENVSTSSPVFIFHGLSPCRPHFPHQHGVASADVEHSFVDFAFAVDSPEPVVLNAGK
jgi:hypothetical protein